MHDDVPLFIFWFSGVSGGTGGAVWFFLVQENANVCVHASVASGGLSVVWRVGLFSDRSVALTTFCLCVGRDWMDGWMLCRHSCRQRKLDRQRDAEAILRVLV